MSNNVNQGDIISLNLDPQSGHEQKGRRPCLVVSNSDYNDFTKMAIVCPITNTDRKSPIQVQLNNSTKTQGFIMCEQMKALDINARGFTVFEQVPSDILDEVLDICFGFIEKV